VTPPTPAAQVSPPMMPLSAQESEERF